MYGYSFADIRYFRFQSLKAGLLSRTGYTGELGYEVYVPVDEAADLWDSILAHPKCAPAGLGARDTLRLEMGYPLYGHELDVTHSPVETGDGMFIDWNKTFIGKVRGAKRINWMEHNELSDYNFHQSEPRESKIVYFIRMSLLDI